MSSSSVISPRGARRLAGTVLLCLTVPIVWSSACGAARIAITEVLADPTGREDALPGGLSHEFVEIANLGDSLISLDGLILSDGDEVDSVLAWAGSLRGHENCVYGARQLLPGQIGIILDPDYATAPVTSRFAIDSGTVLLTVSDAEIGSGLSPGEGIVLSTGTRGDPGRMVAWAADVEPDFPAVGTTPPLSAGQRLVEGTSLVAGRILFSPPRYVACPSILSPGRCELIKAGWIAETTLRSDGDGAVQCSIACMRVDGRRGQTSWELTTGRGHSIDGGLLPETGGPVFLRTRFIPDSTGCVFSVRNEGVRISWDVDLSSVWLPANSIRVSEIAPRATAAIPEWFEIANTSSMPVNIVNWTFGDAESADTLVGGDYILKSGRFAVITKDRRLLLERFPACKEVLQPVRWPALDNYRDTIILTDNRGFVRDRAAYDHQWFTEWNYESLERVSLPRDGLDRNAWVIARASTPGQPNASVTWRSGARPSVEIGPIPFTPNGDGIDDRLSIRVELPPGAILVLSIQSFDGTPRAVFPGPPQPQYFWDGMARGGHFAPAGPFFVVAEIRENGASRLIRKKGVLWR